MSTPPRKPILIREVWAHNLDSEFSLIGSIIDRYPFISMDTEFPGVVVLQIDGEYYHNNFTPHHLYRFLKANVDVMKLIQVGLTFSDSDGNLPDLATAYSFIWQFNFSDFDVVTDRKSAASIDLLTSQGIDFEKNRTSGVDSVKFAELMMSSGMVCNDVVCWIAFHGTYDFGLLIKILTQKDLPDKLSDFMDLLKVYFGQQVYDVKCLIRHCDGLYGGLDQVAILLGLGREVGKCHQAGSDSLLAWRVFRRIWSLYFTRGGMDKYAGIMYRVKGKKPLEVSNSSPMDGYQGNMVNWSITVAASHFDGVWLWAIRTPYPAVAGLYGYDFIQDYLPRKFEVGQSYALGVADAG